MHVRLKLVLAGVLLATSLVSAQGNKVTPAAMAKAVQGRAAQKMPKNVKSLIQGVAVRADKTPLPHIAVRLRNLKANQIEQTGTSNALGEFSFPVQPGVPYVVEIVDQTGRVLAVGDVIVTLNGEVSGALVVLPSRLPAMAGVFDDTASSIISAVAGTGLTVIDPLLPEVSPEE